MSTQSSIEEIRDQEEDIFEDLGCYDFSSLETTPNASQVKEKARQQLNVSSDSPFNYGQNLDETQLRKLKNERVAVLKEETDEIRRQLDFVKNRLGELKKVSKNKESDKNCKQETRNSSIKLNARRNIDERFEADQKTRNIEEADIGFKSKRQTGKQNVENRRIITPQSETKLRPLTGKADCPNCVCDRRMSVCDKCIGLASTSSVRSKHGFEVYENRDKGHGESVRTSFCSSMQNEAAIRRNINCSSFIDDERPIRPAKDKLLARVEAVNDVIVPGKVYNISKSLNEKRTKLAEAINDLQLMMDQVREKGDKLNNERKVVQMYKDQWKFGPSIGGPCASSREKLGLSNQKRNYQSRLDPNLNRDSNSVMGFQHIEPVMKLRQYNPKPRPAPRSKIQQRMRKPETKQTRSKSLESLNSRVSFSPKSNPNLQKAMTNFRNGKASSEINLSSNTNTTTTVTTASSEPTIDEEFKEVEEDIEDIEEDKTGASNSPTSSDKETSQQIDSETEPVRVAQETGEAEGARKDKGNSRIGNEEKVKRMTWFPVFGETEIKTIKRPSTNRKVRILTPEKRSNQIMNKNRNAINNLELKPQRPTLIYRSLEQSKNSPKNSMINRNNNNSQLMSEAKKKLKFASDLLYNEQTEKGTRNQLIINKSAAPIPRPRSSAKTLVENSNSDKSRKQTDESIKTSDTTEEITRLEEMVNKQQKLLEKLVQSQERQMMVSPITVRCSSPICFQHTTTAKSSIISGTHNNRSLIYGLKERLNTSKIRLARILETERGKHQQLKQKVDSSLRKQTDLESENKILKQSLNKCIDTCLRDISNTFESLSATLNDSIERSAIGAAQTNEESDIHSLNGGSGSLLTNAAQLITDNRHINQMKSHVEKIERQRKDIFEELSKEKQKNNQLELQLRENQTELNQLIDAQKRLEAQLASSKTDNSEQASSDDHQIGEASSNKTTTLTPECKPTTSSYSGLNLVSNQTTDTDKSELDSESYNSVEVYRRYIQSMSPDIESLRQERKLILNEFDNIKKMLSDMDR